MKKTFSILMSALIAICILASCNGKNSNTEKEDSAKEAKIEENKKNIVGKWRFADIIPTVETSNTEITEVIMWDLIGDEKKIDSTAVLEFKSDGTLLNKSGMEGTYSLSEKMLTMVTEDFADFGEYRIEGDSLFIIDEMTAIFDKQMRGVLRIADDVKINKVEMVGVFVRE